MRTLIWNSVHLVGCASKEVTKTMAQAQQITRSTHGDSLADIMERVLTTGVVIAGDIQVKLCDVELLTIRIRLLICSVEKARELGISWWWEEQPSSNDSISKLKMLEDVFPNRICLLEPRGRNTKTFGSSRECKPKSVLPWKKENSRRHASIAIRHAKEQGIRHKRSWTL